MKEVDLSSIVIIGLDGEPAELNDGIHKTVANVMFTRAKNLDLVEMARKVFAGGPVLMADSHIAEIRQLVEDKENQFWAFTKKAIFDCLDNAKDKDKKDK